MQIIKRGRAFAQLTSLAEVSTPRSAPKPDVMARLQEVWGDRVFSIKEVEEMREAELEGEEGGSPFQTSPSFVRFTGSR